MRRLARRAEREYPDRPPTHLVTVSTAYVAGTHQGYAIRDAGNRRDALGSPRDGRTRRSPPRSTSTPRSMRHARLRADLEAESRTPARSSTKFTKQGPDRARSGGNASARRARREAASRTGSAPNWSRPAGRVLRRSAGPTAYAFTKALGERVLVTRHPGIPTTVVRPSIIESALAEPRPGWIRGFRMAEPIIISYARGLLKEFPGIPEGVTDVVPVDLVAAAIIACAAAGPEPSGTTRVVHVASGVRNPLRYGHLVELVQSWFTDHPIYDTDGQPIVVPDWSFPGRGRVQRQLAARQLRARSRREAARRTSGAWRARGPRRPG